MTNTIDRGDLLGSSWESGTQFADCVPLNAVMLFPNDEAGRSSFEHEVSTLVPFFQKAVARELPNGKGGAMGGRMPRQSGSLDLHPEVRSLLSYIEMPSGEDTPLLVGHGILAGVQLIYAYVLESRKVETRTKRRANGSRSVVEYIARRHNLGRTHPGRGKRSDGYPAIDARVAAAAWGSHGRASHLWAAWITCQQSLLIPAQSEMWLGIEADEFVRQAIAYADFFEKAVAGKPYWNIAELVTVDLGITEHIPIASPSPPQTVVEVVHRYAAEYKAKTKYLPA